MPGVSVKTVREDVFQFRNAIDYISAEFSKAKEKNPSYSLRAWSLHLGFRDKSTMSKVLLQKRLISESVEKSLTTYFNLDAIQKRYFSLLCEVNRKNGLSTEAIEATMEMLRKKYLIECNSSWKETRFGEYSGLVAKTSADGESELFYSNPEEGRFTKITAGFNCESIQLTNPNWGAQRIDDKLIFYRPEQELVLVLSMNQWTINNASEGTWRFLCSDDGVSLKVHMENRITYESYVILINDELAFLAKGINSLEELINQRISGDRIGGGSGNRSFYQLNLQVLKRGAFRNPRPLSDKESIYTV